MTTPQMAVVFTGYRFSCQNRVDKRGRHLLSAERAQCVQGTGPFAGRQAGREARRMPTLSYFDMMEQCMETARYWIEKLKLEPHPEGGWFRRIYASELKAEDGRPLMTSIYYLLESDDFSAFHRLRMDEQWHFYGGSPIRIHEIDRDGRYGVTRLGEDGFQHTVVAGNLFGASVESGWALVGCTVVPGFDFVDFEMPKRADLLNKYPEYVDIITSLTR